MSRPTHFVRATQAGPAGTPRDLGGGSGATMMCARDTDLYPDHPDGQSFYCCRLLVPVVNSPFQRFFAYSTFGGVVGDNYSGSNAEYSDFTGVITLGSGRSIAGKELYVPNAQNPPPGDIANYAGYGCMAGVVDLPPRDYPYAFYVMFWASPAAHVEFATLQVVFGPIVREQSNCMDGF